MGWLFKLLGSYRLLRELVSQLFKSLKIAKSNVRRKTKDDQVDNAIADALADDSQLRDSGSKKL
tara:strand:+ start:2951 stop:3142 length:192 start_codon:yes stop_codon:yes gene_type:complete